MTEDNNKKKTRMRRASSSIFCSEQVAQTIEELREELKREMEEKE